MSASSSSGTVRILRTRVLLLALPGLIALIYLTAAYYQRDLFPQRIGRLATSSSAESVPPTSGEVSSASALALEEKQQRKACWTQWFSAGTVCSRPPRQWTQQDKLDVIWTWSNNTLTPTDDRESQAWTTADARKQATLSDLLRYSLRSAQQHLHNGFGWVTLLTPDVPTTTQQQLNDDDRCQHLYLDSQLRSQAGQRPCWLAPVDPVYKPPKLLHHRQLACSSASDDLPSSACQESLLAAPKASTTALLAAQAQNVSDVRLVVSPHHIFAAGVSASDFWSPLYGPAFRLTSDVSDAGEIQSAAKDQADRNDDPVIRAAKLLDRRFGARNRRKLLDLPQPVSSSIVQEMQQVWPRELSLDSSISSESVDIAFLTAHYTFEKHREALLWSFIVAKHDRDGDGSYSQAEAQALLRDLGADAAKAFAFPPVEIPVRRTRSKLAVAESLQRARLPVRLGHESIQTSMDGSALVLPRSPSDSASSTVKEGRDGHVQNKPPVVPVCTLARWCLAPLIDLVEGGDTQQTGPSAAEVFARVAAHTPNCGDCMIMHLVAQSGTRGLSAFLPSSNLGMSRDKTLPLTSTKHAAEFQLQSATDASSVKRLDIVTELLSRYVHTVIVQEPYVTPRMPNRLETKLGLTTLEHFNTSSLFSFKQHGKPSKNSEVMPEDAWIWTKYVRAWLSLRFPFPMRFESHTTEL